MDWCIGTALYAIVVAVSLLPISYFHSKLLFNQAFALRLSTVNRRRQLLGELFAHVILRASSLLQIVMWIFTSGMRCLLRAVCGWEPAEPSIEFEPTVGGIEGTLAHRTR